MTAEELEGTLSKLVELRASLSDQWVQFMFLDDTPEVVEMRAAIVSDDQWAAATETRIRRLLVRQRGRESMDAGLADLVDRYRPPGRNQLEGTSRRPVPPRL